MQPYATELTWRIETKLKMESEKNDNLSTLLRGIVKQVVEEVRNEDGKQVTIIANELSEIKCKLKALTDNSVATATVDHGAKTIFGFWNRTDVVFMCDPRLWDKERNLEAPFKSRFAIQRASKNNPSLFVKNAQGYRTALAGDLYDFICNKEARDVMNGKGIKFNNKRK